MGYESGKVEIRDASDLNLIMFTNYFEEKIDDLDLFTDAFGALFILTSKRLFVVQLE